MRTRALPLLSPADLLAAIRREEPTLLITDPIDGTLRFHVDRERSGMPALVLKIVPVIPGVEVLLAVAPAADPALPPHFVEIIASLSQFYTALDRVL